ncbi:MAG TPA: minor capsid protein [Actinophytocola sp.]|uniref:minor capsid protein n=1 Tax=Actinophytocola sp. TaxID=1872138 RepID=UPI002DB772B9|nr:minor capsid protein [Actinophytocola sp.]HEU5475713.1 minor capsid protein [Actinophytocola sp.]
MAAAHRLADLGLVKYPPNGAGSGVPCFVETLPATPDDAVCIRTRPGFPTQDLSGYETPEFQVERRAAVGTGNTGARHAEEIRRALQHKDTETWAPSTPDELSVLWCEANETSPVPLGADQTGRLSWSVSFQIETLTEEVAP